jgi:hypothetical protein
MGYSVKASTPGKIVRGPEPPEDPAAREDLVLSYQARIRQSLEKEDFQHARALLDEALGECPEEPSLIKLRRALSPPEIRSTPALDQDRRQELAWLSENGDAETYRGKWIALVGARVVGMADSLKALLALLEDSPPTATPLIHRIA